MNTEGLVLFVVPLCPIRSVSLLTCSGVKIVIMKT